MGNRLSVGGVLATAAITLLVAMTFMVGSATLAADPPADETADVAAQSDTADGKSSKEADESDDPPTIDPTSINAACYVCHMMFVFESISKTHFENDVTCIECHGMSSAHANDEDIGATPPDKKYQRKQVDAMCRKCHEKHDVAPSLVVERWAKRKRTKLPVVCTDCHGEHTIDSSAMPSGGNMFNMAPGF